MTIKHKTKSISGEKEPVVTGVSYSNNGILSVVLTNQITGVSTTKQIDLSKHKLSLFKLNSIDHLNLLKNGSVSEINNTIPSTYNISTFADSDAVASFRETYIFLVPKQTNDEGVYSEYLWINNDFEIIGSTQVSIPAASSATPLADTNNGSVGDGTTWAKADHTHPKSTLYAPAIHTHDYGDVITSVIPGNIEDRINKNVVTDSNGDITVENKIGTFQELSNIISNKESDVEDLYEEEGVRYPLIIELDKDYKDSGTNFITSNWPIMYIFGNGHTLDGIGVYNENTLIVNNLNFINMNGLTALYAADSASETIVNNCNFANNANNNYGGAIGQEDGKLSIVKCNFINNQTQNDGGAICSSIMTAGFCEIIDSYFANNKCNTNGGAVYIYGQSNNFVIKNSIFCSNTDAQNNYAIYNADTIKNIYNCEFEDNLYYNVNNITFAEANHTHSNFEVTSNKVSTLDNNSSHYPTTAAIQPLVQKINNLMNDVDVTMSAASKTGSGSYSCTIHVNFTPITLKCQMKGAVQVVENEEYTINKKTFDIDQIFNSTVSAVTSIRLQFVNPTTNEVISTKYYDDTGNSISPSYW